MTTCNHYQEPVIIGDETIFVTGSQYLPERGYVPMGNAIFLDKASWTKALADPEARDTDIFDWPDFQAIDLEDFQQLLTDISQGLVRDHQMEIGCIGGHGRTGTVLAGMLIATQDFDSINAVEEIRDTYCQKAVETKSQHDLLNQLAASGFRIMLTVPKVGFWRRLRNLLPF